mgnify:CR=1 FL=1
MDLTDAALRERLDEAIQKCNDEHDTGGMDDYQICGDCILVFGVALRDAARAEMNIVKNRALEALTKQLIKDCDAARADLAVPCQRHGCMWDALEAHETCREEQREQDAKVAIQYGDEKREQARRDGARGDDAFASMSEYGVMVADEIAAAIRGAR